MSVNPQFPPTSNAKTVTTVTVAVIVLHALVGVGLMLMPRAPLPPVTVTPPLEIAFVKPPKTDTPPTDPSPMLVESLAPNVQSLSNPPTKTPDDQPTPVKALSPTDTDSLVKTEKTTTTKSQPPIVEPVPTKPTMTQTVAEQSAVKDTPVAPDTPIIADNQIDSESVESLAHMGQPEPTPEREKAELEKAQREQVEKARLAQEKQAQAQREAAEKIKAEQAKVEQARVEQEKAGRQQAEQTNNKPVNFGAGDARWRSRPNIKLTNNLARIAEQQHLNHLTVQLSVSATGNITDVAIIHSSGNAQIDQFFQQRLRSAKLQPFTQNSMTVAGTVTLPIQIQ